MTNGTSHGTDCFEVDSFLQRSENSKLFKVRNKLNGEFCTMEVVLRSGNVSAPTNPNLQPTSAPYLSKFLVNLRYTFQTRSKFYYILDYIGDKTLDVLYKSHGCFLEADVKTYVSEIVLALEELHQSGLSYGELGLEKVVLDTNGHVVLWRNFCGKKYWSQKECVCCLPGMARGDVCGNEHKISTQESINEDWRSLASLIHRMLTGQDLTIKSGHDKKLEAKYVMQSLALPSTLSVSVQDLIKRLWCGLINTSKQIETHPFFRSTNWAKVRSRSDLPPSIKPDGYSKRRTRSSSPRILTGISHHPSSPSTKENQELAHQNGYVRRSFDRWTRNTIPSHFATNVNGPAAQRDFPDHKYQANNTMKGLHSFGQQLYASSSTQDISEIGIEQGSPELFYTTLPPAGDLSYRHFDSSLSHNRQRDPKAVRFKYGFPSRPDICHDSVQNYQRTDRTRACEWNKNSPYMPRQRCASLTDLDRGDVCFQERQTQPTSWESPISPNYTTFSYTNHESTIANEPSNLRSSLSSSVPNLSDFGGTGDRDQSYRDLISACFRETPNSRFPVHGNQKADGPSIQRGGNHDHCFSDCSCHDCKISRNCRESATLNHRPKVRNNESSAFYNYAPNSFSSSFDKSRTASYSRFESQDNSSQRYSFQSLSQESLYTSGDVGAELEGSRSRSSTIRSQSYTDIDQLDMDNQQVTPMTERYHDRRKSSTGSNDPREKYPLAKMPIPSFEEFKFLRRQSTPDATAATTSFDGTPHDRRTDFYRRDFEKTDSTACTCRTDPQLFNLTSGGNGDSNYSSIYQRIQDIAGRNTNAFEKSSLFMRNTPSSKLGQQRPTLRNDSRSSSALVRASPVYSFTSPVETKQTNTAQSSEVELSYFSRNEVIHKLMVKYGLYGTSRKTPETASPRESGISESPQREDHKTPVHQDSAMQNDRSFNGVAKLAKDKELLINGIEKAPQENTSKRCGDATRQVSDALGIVLKNKDSYLQRRVMGQDEHEGGISNKFTSQDKESSVSMPNTHRVGEKGVESAIPVLTTANSAQAYKERFLYDADNSRSSTFGIKMERNNKTVVDNDKNNNNTNDDGDNIDRLDVDFLSERRRSSVKDLYSSFKRSPTDDKTKHAVSKDLQQNGKIVERSSPRNDKNTSSPHSLQDSNAFTEAPKGSDTPENTSELEKPSLYKTSRTFLFASKFKLGLSKKLKQNKKDDETKKNGTSPLISERSETNGRNQELRRSTSSSSLTSIGPCRTNRSMLGSRISSISQSDLATGENSNLFSDSNTTGMSKKSYHSSLLSIASTYSACSTDTEDNISVFSESDMVLQDRFRERGNRKSRWDSFHSNISADSGSAHMFEYETDSVATELDDEVQEKRYEDAVQTQRKSEADVERADSGYGGDISAVRTPPKVKRRLEEIVEGSSKHWSVVAASAKHWRELAKQRSNQRKESPLRKRAPSLTDDMVQCPDCLKHYVTDDKVDGSKQQNENASKSDLICSKCRARHVERKEAIIELVETETNYGNDLLVLKEEFYIPMQSGSILNPEHLAAIFLNLQELLEVNNQFSARLQKGLEESVAKGDEEFAELNVGKAFLESVEFFQAYEIYCSKQNAAAVLLESLQKKNELLKIFLNVTCRENPKCRKMDLNSFLLAPVQRIMKYPLLLSRIRKATPRWNTDREKLKLAQRKIEEQLSRINALNTTVESKQRKYRGSGLLGRPDSLDKLQMKKMASEILNWSIGEIQLLMYGIFQVAILEFVSSTWNRRGSKKALDVCVLFCIRGHNEPIRVYSDDEGECEADQQPLFPGESDITDACLLLLKKKLNGKYTLFKDPLSLDSCVVCRDSEHKDTFEIICMSQETYLFKATTSRECRRWLKFLRLSAKDLGNWKRRRNGLPNIMIKNL